MQKQSCVRLVGCLRLLVFSKTYPPKKVFWEPLGLLWQLFGLLGGSLGSKGGFQGSQVTPNVDFSLILEALGRQNCRKMLPKCA